MNQKNLRLLNASEVAKIFGISYTKLWRLRRANAFPKPIKVHGGIAWPMYKLEEWIETEFKNAQD